MMSFKIHLSNHVSSSTFFSDDISLLHCPHTRAQALADRGGFTIDEYSNPVTADQLYCGVYYHGATLCFRTTSPR